MSNTITIINSTLASRSLLESQLRELDKAVYKMKAGLVKNPLEESSVTLAGSSYITAMNEEIIAFALSLAGQKQEELNKINLKLSAIGALLGSNNELP